MDDSRAQRSWPEWKENMAYQGDCPTTIATHHPANVQRVIIADRTAHRFARRAWSWANGSTCAHMARFHLRQMGHQPEPMPRVRGLLGAKRALAARGWSTVADMLDAQPRLSRVLPAYMLPGDLGAVETPDGVGAIVLFLDRHRLCGWIEGEGDECKLVNAVLCPLLAAWRV